MNMFRNLLAIFLVVFALGLAFGDPDHWTFLDRGGPDVVNILHICIQFRPFVIGGCLVLALAIFMTRKQY
jgi:hypothetical protein